MRLTLPLFVVVQSLASACTSTPASQPPGISAPGAVLPAVRYTAPVAHDADDPAVWVHPTDLSRSLILGTDKFGGDGALYVFGLDGAVRQRIGPLDRPNNVDVEYGVEIGGRAFDIAVLTERLARRLRVYAIPADGKPLVDLAPHGIPVLEGLASEAGEPMGIGLFKRPSDAATFALVAPKTGPGDGYLWQYRLEGRTGGTFGGRFVRRFGRFSGLGPAPGEAGEIEAVAVDDERGIVYYADERYGVRTWGADPQAPGAGRELDTVGTEGYQLDREGLAVYRTQRGVRVLVSVDQVPGASVLHLFHCEDGPEWQPVHRPAGTVRIAADETDGIDAVGQPMPGFPGGLLVAMNSRDRNFGLFSLEAIEKAVR